MCASAGSTRSVSGRGHVAGSPRPLDADWPPRRWGCARHQGRLWSSSVQHHLWQTHLDGYMASTWRPMSLALFSLVFLQISSSYEQLSAFVEGRWVDYCELNRRRALLFKWWNREEQSLYVYIYSVSMDVLNDDELVWRRLLVLASFVHPSCLHWDSTEELLQWNTRENPYDAEPGGRDVLDKMRAGMISITGGMAGMHLFELQAEMRIWMKTYKI